MQHSLPSDSLDWPLICTALTSALLVRLSFAHGAFGIVPFLALTLLAVTVWLVARAIGAIRRRELLGLTSVVVAAIFVGAPLMVFTPWDGGDVAPAAQEPRFASRRIDYHLRVATFKLADPKRTFIVFKPAREPWSGEASSRVAYDETDTLARGRTDQVIALARSQSPQDVAVFSACGWRARRVEGHYYVVDFSC